MKPMSKKKLTPNYQLMFESAVAELQLAYSEYKRAQVEVIRWTFIDKDGRFAVLDGYEKRKKQIEDTEAEVVRLMELVNELRYKISGE